MHWNPFSHLVETKKYTSSRFIRSSFAKRVQDTFFAFFNGFGSSDLKLLDYIFPIPFIIWQVICIRNLEQPTRRPILLNYIFYPFVIALGIVAAVLDIAKMIVACLLTLAVLPVTASAHLLIKPEKDRLDRQGNKLKVFPVKTLSSDYKRISQVNDRKDFEVETELSKKYTPNKLKKMAILPIFKIFNNWHLCRGNPESFIQEANDVSIALFEVELGAGPLPERPEVSSNVIAFIKKSPENSEAIKAILSANRFWATSNIEEAKSLPKIEQEFEVNGNFPSLIRR